MTAWLALLRHEIRVVLREGGAVGTGARVHRTV